MSYEPFECPHCYAENDATQGLCWQCGEEMGNK